MALQFHCFLPLDPSVPVLLGAYRYLKQFEGDEAFGNAIVALRGEHIEGERVLEVDLAEAQQPDQGGLPTPRWDFVLVLRYTIPGRREITAGPNRGKLEEPEACWEWWQWVMRFVQKTREALEAGVDGVVIDIVFPVNSGLVESQSVLGGVDYEYRIPMKARCV